MEPTSSASSNFGSTQDARRFYRSPGEGQVSGPFTRAEIDAAVARGEIDASTLLCVEGTTEWRAASVVLFGMREGAGSIATAPTTPPIATEPIATRVGIAAPIVATTLSFCLCCLPIGLVPLIYAFIANARFEAGDRAGGEKAATLVRNWMIATWILLALSCAINVWGSYAMLDALQDALDQLTRMR
ncbi:MAG: domain 2 [Planctomycetota bacterium]